MFGIEINFLTGRFTAAAHHDRARAEWPPHPARLFSALVATWADSDDPDQEERAALEWLEAQEAPAISAPPADERTAATHFVPVNDASVIASSAYEKRAQKIEDLLREHSEELAASGGEETGRARTLRNDVAKQRDVAGIVSHTGDVKPDKAGEQARALFPEGRNRHARQWPSVTLRNPRVVFSWEAEPAGETRAALDGLLSRVTRLGHSSSLVSCRVASDAPAPSHRPARRGEVMRAVGAGQLAALESEYASHRGCKPRALPYRAVRYRTLDEEQRAPAPLSPNTAGDWHVFEFVPRSRKLPSTRVAEIALAMRAALFTYAPDPLPEGLTGHRADGSPSPDPHVAFLPLPYVGYEHADGRLLGIAVSIPKSLDRSARDSVLRAIGHWERSAAGGAGRYSAPELHLTFGRKGRLGMIRAANLGAIAMQTLMPHRWRGPSRRWVSAAPVALPAHPGPLGAGTAAARAKAWARAERALAAACRHAGLPEPQEITLALTPFIKGARPAPDFPPFRQGRGPRPVARRLVHASLVFSEPTAGPLMLGAGRFLGLGLMRPLPDAKGPNA